MTGATFFLIKPLVAPAGNSHGVASWNRSGLVKNNNQSSPGSLSSAGTTRLGGKIKNRQIKVSENANLINFWWIITKKSTLVLWTQVAPSGRSPVAT